MQRHFLSKRFRNIFVHIFQVVAVYNKRKRYKLITNQIKNVHTIIKINPMGNSNSQQSSFQYILDHWEPHYFNQEQEIMRNMDDGRLAQRKDIFLDMQRTYQNDVDIYKLRKQNQFNLVQVYAIQKKINTTNKSLSLKMCQNKCTQVQSFQILTQYITKRLTDIYFYHFKEFLYAFFNSLIGLKKINSIFGKVKITQRMIGTNYKGKIKIWVNQNFADNMPQLQIPDYQKGDEQVMILNLAQLLQSRCAFTLEQVQNFNLQFKPYSRMFRTSLRFIQCYIIQNHLKIDSLPIENRVKQDQMIQNKNIQVKPISLQQYNPELTTSNKTFGSTYQWYSNNNNGFHKNSNQNIVYNRSQKKSPYLKLNLMQSFAKTQPKANDLSQFDGKTEKQLYHFDYSTSSYHPNINRKVENIVFVKKPLYEQQQNKKYFTYRQPLQTTLEGHNFPIYKKLSQNRQCQ